MRMLHVVLVTMMIFSGIGVRGADDTSSSPLEYCCKLNSNSGVAYCAQQNEDQYCPKEYVQLAPRLQSPETVISPDLKYCCSNSGNYTVCVRNDACSERFFEVFQTEPYKVSSSTPYYCCDTDSQDVQCAQSYAKFCPNKYLRLASAKTRGAIYFPDLKYCCFSRAGYGYRYAQCIRQNVCSDEEFELFESTYILQS